MLLTFPEPHESSKFTATVASDPGSTAMQAWHGNCCTYPLPTIVELAGRGQTSVALACGSHVQFTWSHTARPSFLSAKLISIKRQDSLLSSCHW